MLRPEPLTSASTLSQRASRPSRPSRPSANLADSASKISPKSSHGPSLLARSRPPKPAPASSPVLRRFYSLLRDLQVSSKPSSGVPCHSGVRAKPSPQPRPGPWPLPAASLPPGLGALPEQPGPGLSQASARAAVPSDGIPSPAFLRQGGLWSDASTRPPHAEQQPPHLPEVFTLLESTRAPTYAAISSVTAASHSRPAAPREHGHGEGTSRRRLGPPARGPCPPTERARACVHPAGPQGRRSPRNSSPVGDRPAPCGCSINGVPGRPAHSRARDSGSLSVKKLRGLARCCAPNIQHSTRHEVGPGARLLTTHAETQSPASRPSPAASTQPRSCGGSSGKAGAPCAPRPLP